MGNGMRWISSAIVVLTGCIGPELGHLNPFDKAYQPVALDIGVTPDGFTVGALPIEIAELDIVRAGPQTIRYSVSGPGCEGTPAPAACSLKEVSRPGSQQVVAATWPPGPNTLSVELLLGDSKAVVARGTVTVTGAGFVDACRTNNGGCHVDATCTSTNGTAACRCPVGWIGDGFDCSPPPNARPVVASVRLSPANPTKATPITAQAAFPTDADGDRVSLRYAWTAAGTPVAGQTGTSLAPSFFAKGQTVAVVVTPNDGTEDGESVTASMLVQNSAPTAPVASITQGARDADDIVCTVSTPSTDLDGDAVSYTFAWAKNGQSFSGSNPVDSRTSKVSTSSTAERDVFACTVSGTDGAASTAGAAATARVNARPVVAGITLDPASPTKAGPITARVGSSSDADNDAISLRYAWTVNGTPVSGQTGETLASSFFARGQTVAVVVVPFDGKEDGSSAGASAVVANAPPSMPVVQMSPVAPRDADDIVCSITTPSTDPDGDAITVDFVWTKNGQPFAGATHTNSTTSTVAAAATGEEDRFGCAATVRDGFDTVTTASVEATVLNPNSSCSAIKTANPTAADGLYDIDPDGNGPIAPARLFCDMTNGGWTLVANIYDSAGDDAPNSTDYVVSGWQQTASGQWNRAASLVDRNASGTGSAAVSLAFVAALKTSASQANLKMCFVHQNGTDTTCRSSHDGSMTLVSYPTGNPKLTVYSGNTLPYTYGRLAGLAGSTDGYAFNQSQDMTYCIPCSTGMVGEFGENPPPELCERAVTDRPSYNGVWHGNGFGLTYRPDFTDDWETRGATTRGTDAVANPNPSTYGFRLYIGPDMLAGSLVERTISSQSFKFSYIPAGTFMMGSPTSDTESQNDERPQHQVTITKPFLILRTEVTQAQWVAIKGSNPSNFQGDLSRPVEQVSWYDAVDFCNQLSIRDGFTAAYTINGTTVTLNAGATGYRLPTEAEWEYAARAGTTTPRYGTLDQIAWYPNNSGNTTRPVGQKTPNAWNLYDMLGNVWEWNWDWYGAYASGSQTDPQGPASGPSRVCRGGSWNYDASYARTTGPRGCDSPNRSYRDLGFRPLRSLP